VKYKKVVFSPRWPQAANGVDVCPVAPNVLKGFMFVES
jgi:hypothetical protein